MLEVIENIENLTEEILDELQNGLEEGESNEYQFISKLYKNQSK